MANEKKETDFHLRLTPKEKVRLQRRANEAKMPLSRYLLEMGLTGKIVNYDYLLKCFLQMRRIGNNINQLAHQANARGAATGDEITEALHLVRQATRLVRERL